MTKAPTLPAIFDTLTPELRAQFDGLKPSLQHFLIEYLVDHNETQAAIRAGYSKKTAHVQGCQILKKLKPIAEALVKAQTAQLATKTVLTKERLMELVSDMVLYDPRKFFAENGAAKHIATLDDLSALALQGFDVFEEFEGKGKERELIGYTKKFKLADRFQYVQLYARLNGMLQEEGDGRNRPLTPLESAAAQTLLTMQRALEAKMAKAKPALIGNGQGNGKGNGHGH